MKNCLKIVSILCILLCAAVFLTACKSGKEEKQALEKYDFTVYVTDEEGVASSRVEIMLYHGGGEELSPVPVVTDEEGKAVFRDYETADCWAQVLSAPDEYILDSYGRYYFDDAGCTTIVLEENKEVTELEDYVATIGKARYEFFDDALKVANSTTGDVTIVLAADLTLKDIQFSNEASNNVTIDGAGHTITSSGGTHLFRVNQANCEITFKNMHVKHLNPGAFVHDYLGNTILVENVTIDATEGKEYTYAIFNLMGVGATTNLTLTGVDVKLAVATETSDASYGIVRTGSTGMVNEKTVNLTMTDCNFDTTAATGARGVMVMENTLGEIIIKNSKITTLDTYPLSVNYQPVTLEAVVLDSKSNTHKNTPIQFAGQVVSDNAEQAHEADCAAKIGETEYPSLTTAAIAVYHATEDVEVVLQRDEEIEQIELFNAKGKNVILNGNGYTVKSENGNHTFKVSQTVGTVEIKNMVIDHRNSGCALQTNGNITMNMTDVDILATKGTLYKYALINLAAPGDGNYLNLTRVNMKIAIEAAGSDGAFGMIRTGNATEKDTKTVAITLTDCNFDSTGSIRRSGIMVMPTTTAYIELTNSTIRTRDAYPIRANHQTIVVKDCVLSSQDAYYNARKIQANTNVVER